MLESWVPGISSGFRAIQLLFQMNKLLNLVLTDLFLSETVTKELAIASSWSRRPFLQGLEGGKQNCRWERFRLQSRYSSNCTRCLFIKFYTLILDAPRMYGSAASSITGFERAVFFPNHFQFTNIYSNTLVHSSPPPDGIILFCINTIFSRSLFYQTDRQTDIRLNSGCFLWNELNSSKINEFWEYTRYQIYWINFYTFFSTRKSIEKMAWPNIRVSW